ncbi:histidine kinase [Flaviaesturariibacter flavus]|uniref:Histidine kinase n=1 Tax=Flaviaesturariibacter flavus TaxID=2502780 RepID=A0A4R1BBJ7_9BACT|nr:histidine kinase [Flaviaesturariibacter flavus]TCJ14308.1 histidine kinase [Flaviaesturariibacter flavus]
MQRYLNYLARPENHMLARNGAAALLLFITSLLLHTHIRGDGGEVMVLFGVLLPYAILQYTISFMYLLPLAHRRRRPFWTYMVMVGAVLVVTALPFGLLVYTIRQHDDDALAFTVVNAAINFFGMAPITFYFYRRSRRLEKKVVHLEKELGQSEAGLDFLRSQINPHFLFNALNTLYGLALNEGAERTAGGVQMLGDMMRFMMQENLQPEIDLARDVEYLEHYISLQRLRTEGNGEVQVSLNIGATLPGLRIAPMLLIPFVENAFKHGVSYREPSFIKVLLEEKNGTLFFDVHNSVHEKPHDDPERYKSGIGLENVRRRLELLYPGRHQLFVRGTEKEFFVHLSIDLTSK